MRKHFRPELLNRLDEVVVFDPLSHDQLRKVSRLQMKDVASRLAERGIALAVTDAALDFVLAESYDPVSTWNGYDFFYLYIYVVELCFLTWHLHFQVYGARPIRRWLEKNVVTELSKMLIREEIDENSTVYIDAGTSGDKLAYKVEKGGMVDATTGQKSDVLIQIPNGVRNDTSQAVKKMRIEEVDDDDAEMYD